MMYAIDPTMSFAQVVQYYKDYVKRTKSYGRKPVSFLRFVTGRYQNRMIRWQRSRQLTRFFFYYGNKTR